MVVTIYDDTGNFVRDYETSALAAGKQSLTWDGRDRNGNVVADGAYTFEVQAVDDKGAKLNVKTFSKGTVTGVTFEDGITYLITGRDRTAIGNVIQITRRPRQPGHHNGYSPLKIHGRSTT